MNPLASIAEKLQKEMESKLALAEPVNHSGMKGDSYEDCWISWMRAYLPSRYSVSKGKVIDCEGHMSDQIDVIIYDRIFSSSILVENGITIVPAESVYAVFESKSDLSSENIRYAQNKAKSVRVLERTKAKIRHLCGDSETENKPILAGILTKKSSIADYNGEIMEYNPVSTDPVIKLDFGCSADGHGFFTDSKNIEFLPANNSLVNFLYRLLTALQKQGSVAAIQYDRYLDTINN